MRPDSPSPGIPFLIACAGIATFSAMDVLMKGLSIDIGAYNAVLWRTGTGTLLAGALYFASRPKWPDKATMRIHAWRSLFVAGMALCFFWALARLPMAEAIALAFVAPLMALYMAAIFWGEKIGPRSIAASMVSRSFCISAGGNREPGTTSIGLSPFRTFFCSAFGQPLGG